MSIDSRIYDPQSGNFAKVNGEGELEVVVHSHPPLNEKVVMKPYRAKMVSVAGSEDMRTAGTLSRPVTYKIEASPDVDIFIKTLSFVISDAGATLVQFGSITALTNGCELFYSSHDAGEVILHDSLTSNFDFVQFCGGNPAFGTGNSSFRANNVVSTSEAFIPLLDLQMMMGFPWGLQLKKGSKDFIGMRIKDDTQALDRFDATALGMQI